MEKEHIPILYSDGVIVMTDIYTGESIVVKEWEKNTAKYCRSTTYGQDGDSNSRWYLAHKNAGRWYLAQVSEDNGISAKETDEQEIESLGIMASIETINQ